MKKYRINEIDGLYIARNKEADSTILIGVSKYDGQIMAEEIAEDYRIEMNLDGHFEVESVTDNPNALTKTEFTWNQLVTEYGN